MRERGTKLNRGTHEASSRQHGFSLIELCIVVMLIVIISAIALVAYLPTLQDARFDAAMREIVEQLRQAREDSISNRRYLQVTFPTVVVGGITQYQVVITQRNDLPPTNGVIPNAVLSTIPIEAPARYLVFPGAPDTPDAFGNAAPVVFEGTVGGPLGGMLFQSDGELVDGTTLQPINGTVFVGYPGNGTASRAITVLGGTGRIRGWKGTGNSWFRF